MLLDFVLRRVERDIHMGCADEWGAEVILILSDERQSEWL